MGVVLAGTSGFSYSQWVGGFYPPETKQSGMLEQYARRLPCVELNNTFYRLPNPRVLEGYREVTPSGFRFSIKASRRITHVAKLKNSRPLVEYLLSGVQRLGDRLGTVLFQCPPTFRLDLHRLESFFDDLPEQAQGVPLTFEFRHRSWFDSRVEELFRRRGIALCWGDGDEGGRLAPPLWETAGHAYLRLRKERYRAEELEQWAERVRKLGASRVFVFFKHEQQGPDLARRFLELCR